MNRLLEVGDVFEITEGLSIYCNELNGGTYIKIDFNNGKSLVLKGYYVVYEVYESRNNRNFGRIAPDIYKCYAIRLEDGKYNEYGTKIFLDQGYGESNRKENIKFIKKMKMVFI